MRCATRRFEFRLSELSVWTLGALAAIAAGTVYSTPTGPTVTRGQVVFDRPSASVLQVTNTPGAIIQWQGFSIGRGEATRFVQSSPASAVLNRVVGGDPSSILGQLSSNGRVYLINPSGIVFGSGSVIDTAGLVASTLGLSDADFLAGRHRFSAGERAGDIVNAGAIRATRGGEVMLIAPRIENSGIIEAPNGSILLAAGRSVNIAGPGLSGIRFEVQAPSDEVVNLGTLAADGGVVNVFAGTLRHSGAIRANTLERDREGNIVLAARDIRLDGGSTIEASGAAGGEHRGGSVRIVADGTLDMKRGAVVRVDGGSDGGDGGFLELSGKEKIALNGEYSGRVLKAGYRNGSLLLDPANIEIVAATGLNLTVPVGISPRGVGVLPDGSRAYVANQGVSSNSVSVIDVPSGIAVGTIAMGSSPAEVAVSPDGTRVYVSRPLLGNVAVIDTATNAVIASLTAGANPSYMTINPSGTRLYVANGGTASTITVLNLSTGGSILGTVNVGQNPTGMAVTPDGTRLYAAIQDANLVRVVNTATNTVSGTISGAFNLPRGLAMSADGSRVYVPNYLGNNVLVIDTVSNAVTASVAVGGNPYGAHVSADGTKVYVANFGTANVSVINTATNTVGSTIGVGSGPRGVDVSPASGSVLVTENNANSVTIITTPAGDTGGDGIVTAGESPGATLRIPAAALNGAWTNVSLAATNDVTVSFPIGTGDVPAGGSLTLDAGNDVRINAAIGSSGTRFAHDLNLIAGNDVVVAQGIHLANNAASIRANRNVALTSTISTQGGAVTLNADRDGGGGGNIVLGAGAVVDAAGGNIVLGGGANPATTPAVGAGTGSAQERAGIYLDNATITTAVTGSISLRGQAVNDGTDSPGIDMKNGSIVQSVAGAITLHGTGGGASGGVGGNQGLRIGGSGTRIEASSGGAVALTGIGGSVASIAPNGSNVGVLLQDGAEVRAGEGGIGGSISITGTGAGSGTGNIGVQVRNGARVVGSTTTSVTLLGSGAAATNDNYGVKVEGPGTLVATSSGPLSVTGNASGSADGLRNIGLLVNGGASIESTGGTLGTIQLAGTGGGSTAAEGSTGVEISGAGTRLVSAAGNVTIAGTGGNGPLGLAHGVTVSDAAQITTVGSAGLSIQGTGGGTGSNNIGVQIKSGAAVTGAGSGTIGVDGTGSAAGTSGNHGVLIDGAGTSVSGAAAITIRGTGGTGAGNSGVLLASSTVSGTGAGILRVEGTATGSGSGTALLNAALVTASGGEIQVVGTSAGTSGSGNDGVLVASGSGIVASGSARFSVSGTAGGGSSASSAGVVIVDSGSRIEAAAGDNAVAGIGQGSGGNTFGVLLWDPTPDAPGANTSPRITHSGASGSLTVVGTHVGPASAPGLAVFDVGTIEAPGGASLYLEAGQTGLADAIALTGAVSGRVRGTGALFLQPTSPSRAIGIGAGAAGTYNLAAADLAAIQSGFSSITIGRPDHTAPIEVGAASFNAPTIIRAPFGAGRVAITDDDGNPSTPTLLGTGSITVQAGNSIVLNNNANIASAGGAMHVTLNADRDEISAGQVVLNPGSRIASSGGNIVLGGGANPLVGRAGGVGAGTDVEKAGIHVDGASLTAGTGSIALRGRGVDGSANAAGVRITSGSVLQTTSGAITLDGIGGAGTDNNVGAYVSGSLASSSGPISITGVGGAASGSSNVGVWLSQASIGSTSGAITVVGSAAGSTAGFFNAGVALDVGTRIVGSGTATITLHGSGGGGTFANNGIAIDGAGTGVQSTDGGIALTGIGGGSGSNNIGIAILNAAFVESSGAGSITLAGTGGAGTDAGTGVAVVGAGAQVRSTGSGPIAIMGTGQGNGIQNHGVAVFNAGLVESAGSGSIGITGLSSPNGTESDGVHLSSNAIVRSVSSGAIEITGTANGSGPALGVALFGDADVIALGTGNISIAGTGAGTGAGIGVGGGVIQIGGPSASGDITLSAHTPAGTDSIGLGNALTQSSGTLTLQPIMPSTSIGIAGGTGTFNLDAADLNSIESGFARVVIGRTDGTGLITVNPYASIDPVNVIARSPGTGSAGIVINGPLDLSTGSLALDTTGPIMLSGTLTSGTLLLKQGTLAGSGTINATLLNNGGTVKPGGSPGTLIVSGNYIQEPGGTLDIELAGTQQGVSYDLLRIGGTASLGGTLNVQLSGGFQPQTSDTFDIMTYRSASGSFATVNMPIGYPLSHGDSGAAYRLSGAGLTPPVPAQLPPVVVVTQDAQTSTLQQTQERMLDAAASLANPDPPERERRRGVPLCQ